MSIGSDRDTGQTAVSKRLQKIPGLGINVNSILIQGTNLGNKVQASLSLLFLQLEGNSANGSLGDTLHEMGGETCNFVAHALGGGDGYLIDYTLVGVEVECETSVVLLDDGACTLLDGLGTNSLRWTRTMNGKKL